MVFAALYAEFTASTHAFALSGLNVRVPVCACCASTSHCAVWYIWHVSTTKAHRGAIWQIALAFAAQKLGTSG
jgi:hypothetical protein